MKTVSILTVAALGLISASPCFAQSDDPGASGVVDGTDVRQFLNSGAVVDPVRMEEAAIPFDRAIKMPQKQAKSWDEEMQREKAIKEGIPYEYTGSYTRDGNSPVGGTRSGSASASGTTDGGGPHADGKKKPRHALHSIKNAFLRTFDFIGFPVSWEDLPGEVDNNLAGDLPPGEDPRVYVHEKRSAEYEKQKEANLEKAEDRQ
ncbi:MAG: hypothetical protein IPM23_24855 [Candidatus Melainabacteria bacterium]|nr:hypothetical protein [Candidatus Melainabacteria bacterium]